MSVERAMVAQAKPQMFARMANAFIYREAVKGCRPEVSSHAVALEPRYLPIHQAFRASAGEDPSDAVYEPLPAVEELKRLELWLSPREVFGWLSSELFLKQLSSVSHRIAFEVIGNAKRIRLIFLVHVDDFASLHAAFGAQFQHCELSDLPNGGFEEVFTDPKLEVTFLDFYPPPPYSHLITRPGELKVTPYRSLVSSLMAMKPPSVGLYQALFQPARADHDWHRNVQVLLDLEYNMKLLSGLQSQQKYLQQSPSGDLRQMALELETKAHNDKPFFFLSVRLAVASPHGVVSDHLRTLVTYINLFRNGGQPFRSVTKRVYKPFLTADGIARMFDQGLTYRSGFLVNSEELAGFVHVPPAAILENREPPIPILQTLPLKSKDLSSGTPIGRSEYAGIEQSICIPFETRSRSTHIIGKPGQAKSTTMAWMVLDDIEKGMGVAVLDPHGDLVEALLGQIKREHVERTIYFDPALSGYVPLWNPLWRKPGQGVSRVADNLVAAIKTVVTGWGDRLETLLRQGIYALLQLPNSTLLDLSNLLRRGSEESELLQKLILESLDNVTARGFWKYDFRKYPNEALDPPKHKLSKLLLSDRVALMLSQPENLINFRGIMDDGKILLINLSTIGPEEREILGCFILSLLHMAALSRSDLPPNRRRQFHIHVDEAHRFVTEALEDIIAETRKFGVSLNLAHHYLSQFGIKKVDALSSVGTTIIMNLDTKDAKYLTKDLQDLVSYKDLITLERGEAVARIGNEVIRLKTPGPLKIHEKDYREDIIRHSRRLYYKSESEVREIIRNRNRRWDQPYAPLNPLSEKEKEEFVYDEF